MKKQLFLNIVWILAAILCVSCSTPESQSETKAQIQLMTPSRSTSAPRNDPAVEYAKSLTLEQQIAQMFFIRCPENGTNELLKQYNIGGLILFGRDFKDETPDSLRDTISVYQQNAKTPLLIGVDEEGGTVVRASAYSAKADFVHRRNYMPRAVWMKLSRIVPKRIRFSMIYISMLISGQFAIFLLILRILYMPAPSGKVPRKQANTRLQSSYRCVWTESAVS